MTLTLSAVNATETNQSTNFTEQHTVSEKTFESIQNTIDNSTQSDTILLEGSYIGSGKAININKSLTVKGLDDARLNANSKSQIFLIKADNVVIENIAFFNGYNDLSGGAVYVEGNNVKIINCNFISNKVDFYGAGIFSKGDNVSIINCQFTKNTATYTGGAIEIEGNNNYVEGSTFVNNLAGHVGSGIAWVGDNGILRNSVFDNTIIPSYPAQYGGAIAWMGANGIIETSIFNENTAKKSGAAIYWRGINGTVKNSIFTNNTSANDTAYCGNPENLKNNYWGVNMNSKEEFIEYKFIYFNQSFQTHQNWINLISDSNGVAFKSNTGETLKESLPDYEITVNGVNIIISNNQYLFTKATVIVASNKIVYNNGESFKITLKDENNQKLSNKNLLIKINGVEYNAKTDKNGLASLKLKTLKPKIYNVKITFKGDEKYLKSTKTVKLTVKKQKTIMKVKANTKKKTIKITLKNQFKKALSKKTVKLTINKKIYKLKTNNKGTITFKLNLKTKMKYKFTVKYAGDSYHMKNAKTGFLKLK